MDIADRSTENGQHRVGSCLLSATIQTDDKRVTNGAALPVFTKRFLQSDRTGSDKTSTQSTLHFDIAISNDSSMVSASGSLASLLRDPKYSDLKICCDSRDFAVHRVIVCSASKVLARECDGAFEVRYGCFAASLASAILNHLLGVAPQSHRPSRIPCVDCVAYAAVHLRRRLRRGNCPCH